MVKFVQEHAVRVFAVAAAAVPLLAALWPQVPWEACLGFAGALLGAGELTQRAENRKTLEAFLEPSPVQRLSEEAVMNELKARLSED